MASENEFEFQSNVLPQSSFHYFYDMKEKEEYCDVVLRAADLSVPAHSLVIAAAIPYFRNALRSKGAQNEVDIPDAGDLQPNAIQSIIQYAYHGKIKISLENTLDLLSAACRFQVDEIRDACCSFLSRNFHPENATKIRDLARQMECEDLVQNVDRYIAENFNEICSGGDFLTCSFQDFKELIKRDDLVVESEETVYDAVMKWVAHTPGRENHLPDLICDVRLTLLRKSYLRLHVARNRLIRDSSQCRDWVDEVTNYLMFPDEVELGSEVNTKPRRYTKNDRTTNIEENEEFDSLQLHSIERSGNKETRQEQLLDEQRKQDFQYAVYPDRRQDMFPKDVELNSEFDTKPRRYTRNGCPTNVEENEGSDSVHCIERRNVKEIRQEQLLHDEDLRKQDLRYATYPDRLQEACGYDKQSLSRRIDHVAEPQLCDSTDGDEDRYGGMYAFHAKLLLSVQHFDERTKMWEIKKRDFFTINSALVTGLSDKICFLDCENMCYYDPRNKELCFADRYIQGRAAASAGTHLYVFGGSDGVTVFDTAECMDLETEDWSDIDCMEKCREYAGCVVLEAYIYLIGGNDLECVHSTVESYDIEANRWSFVEPTLVGRSKLGAASLNGKIYICGGIISLEEQESTVTSEVYDPITDQWTYVSPLNVPRFHFTLLPYAGKLHAVGGFDEKDSFINEVDIYDPRIKKWGLGSPTAPDLQITGAAVV